MHWANQYIGLPWVSGENGPHAFDCWGFVRHVQREHFGIEVPVINVDATNVRTVLKCFKEHPELLRYEIHDSNPQVGDVALLKHSKHPVHCGVWIDVDGGGVLHCAQGMGVVFQSPSSLRISGWSGLQFYRLKEEFR